MPEQPLKTPLFDAAVSHVHWLEKGFLEIWLLIRALERASDAHPETTTDLQRRIGAHFEECMAVDAESARSILPDLMTISARHYAPQPTGPHPVKTFLVRERRRLIAQDQSGTPANTI